MIDLNKKGCPRCADFGALCEKTHYHIVWTRHERSRVFLLKTAKLMRLSRLAQWLDSEQKEHVGEKL